MTTETLLSDIDREINGHKQEEQKGQEIGLSLSHKCITKNARTQL